MPSFWLFRFLKADSGRKCSDAKTGGIATPVPLSGFAIYFISAELQHTLPNLSARVQNCAKRNPCLTSGARAYIIHKVQPSAHKYTDKGFIRMVRKFIRYYKPHKKLFLIDMLCAFIVALCDLFYPIIAKDIINDYVPSQNLRMLLIWAGVLLGIYALKALLNYIIQYWGHVVGVRMQGDMRRDMFRRLQRLPFSFYDENKTGAVMSRLVNDLFDVSELAHHGPEDLFLSAIMLVGSFVMLATIDIWLTVIVFAFLPFIVLFAVKTRREMNRAFKKAREEIAEINANLETSISGIRVTRAYTAEDYENAGFDRANERFKRARGDSYRIMGVFHSGTSFFMDLLYLAVLVAGGLFFYYGRIDVGEFAAFLLYINMFLKPVNRIVAIFEQLQN